jgi:Ferroportin1 (FPN1).
MAFSGEFPYFFVESCTVSQYDPRDNGRQRGSVRSSLRVSQLIPQTPTSSTRAIIATALQTRPRTLLASPGPSASAFIPHTSYRHGTSVYSKQQSCTSWQLYSQTAPPHLNIRPAAQHPSHHPYSAHRGWIDRANRLSIVRVSILGQRISVAASCCLFWVMLWREDMSHRMTIGLFAVTVVFACVEKVSAGINMVSVERDWVVVITERNGPASRNP